MRHYLFKMTINYSRKLRFHMYFSRLHQTILLEPGEILAHTIAANKNAPFGGCSSRFCVGESREENRGSAKRGGEARGGELTRGEERKWAECPACGEVVEARGKQVRLLTSQHNQTLRVHRARIVQAAARSSAAVFEYRWDNGTAGGWGMG